MKIGANIKNNDFERRTLEIGNFEKNYKNHVKKKSKILPKISGKQLKSANLGAKIELDRQKMGFL